MCLFGEYAYNLNVICERLDFVKKKKKNWDNVKEVRCK